MDLESSFSKLFFYLSISKICTGWNYELFLRVLLPKTSDVLDGLRKMKDENESARKEVLKMNAETEKECVHKLQRYLLFIFIWLFY